MQAASMPLVLLTHPRACEPHWATTYFPMPGQSRSATGNYTFEDMFASDSEHAEHVLQKPLSLSQPCW